MGVLLDQSQRHRFSVGSAVPGTADLHGMWIASTVQVELVSMAFLPRHELPPIFFGPAATTGTDMRFCTAASP